MIDVSKLKARKSVNKRNVTSVKEDVDIRFKRTDKNGKVSGRFFVGDRVWEELNLDENGILPHFYNVEDEKAVIFQKVDNDVASVLKKKKGAEKKAHSFKADQVEKDLVVCGLLPSEGEGEWKFDLEKVESDTVDDLYMIVDNSEKPAKLEEKTPELETIELP